jgi:hypothetical protein
VPDIRQRPSVPLEHASEVVHRRQIAERANIGLPVDGSKEMTGPLTLMSYTVAGVPSAALWEGGIIYVSNESGGKVVAFSDGASWRRLTDRSVIS